MKVLIVEDETSLAHVLSDKLTKTGYTTTVASDGDAALEALHNAFFDAVLLDVLLPGKDGIEVLRAMKKDAHLKLLPVIVFSNVDDPTVQAQVRKLGVCDYLIKPEHALEEVTEILARALSAQ